MFASLQKRLGTQRKIDIHPQIAKMALERFCQAEFETATGIPEFTSCFGVFDLAYIYYIKPIEIQMQGAFFRQSSHQGMATVRGSGRTLMTRKKRLLVLNGRFLGEFSPENGTLKHVHNCWGLKVTPRRHHMVVIEGEGKKLHLKFESESERGVWQSLLSNLSTTYPRGSFCQVRMHTPVRYFITASEYFPHLINSIEQASTRIYISDWAFAPGLYLTRNADTEEARRRFRVDRMLAAAAQRGVQVYVMIWHASPVAFSLEVNYVCQHLRSLGCVVLSHPVGLKNVISLWSHHQKFVVVDESVAYVGGIDLCYGRYDTPSHPLLDPTGEMFPGRDYINYNFNGDSNGPSSDHVLDRTRFPRMPWQDVHAELRGEAAFDVAVNFIDRWNHARHQRRKEGVAAISPHLFPMSDSDRVHEFAPGGGRSKYVQVLRSISAWSAGMSRPTERSILNTYKSLIRAARNFIYIENQYFITANSKSDSAENTLGETLYRRLFVAIQNQERFRVIVVLPVCPATPSTTTTRYVTNFHLLSISKGSGSLLGRLAADFCDRGPQYHWRNFIGFFSLRTYDFINPRHFDQSSSPLQHIECLHASDDTSFTSSSSSSLSSWSSSSGVTQSPRIGASVLLIIHPPQGRAQAIRTIPMASIQELTFAAFYERFVPAVDLPISELVFSIETPDTKTFWCEYSCTEVSLDVSTELQIAQRSHPDVRIVLCAPRTPVSEQIYVHSKLMVVDDEVVILGSANINDRSLLGHRDSEIAFVAAEYPQPDCQAAILRRRLFCQFLGLRYPQDEEIVSDPCSDAFWQLWQTTATENAQIYQSVFPLIPEVCHTIPSNTASVYQTYVKEQSPMLKRVRGQLIHYPYEFLRQEYLVPGTGTPESLVPKKTFQ